MRDSSTQLLDRADERPSEPVCPVTVERTAKVQLERTGYHKLKAIECSFANGTMVLRGRVPSYYHKQLAQEALRRVNHVHQLVNHLEVASKR